MAEKVKFQPQTFDINSINNGNRFGYDGIQPEAVNAPIEAAAYVQSLATNQPNVENANKVGVPTVSIELAPNGTPRFKFEELKGKDHSAEIQAINSSLLELKDVQKDHSAEIQANSSSIETLEKVLIKKGQMDIIEVEQAYTTRETANGENIVDGQFAEVTEIKGRSVRDESTNTIKQAFINSIKSTGRNLIPYPYIETTKALDGITFTDNGDGSITAVGTATGNAYFILSSGIDFGETDILGSSNGKYVGSTRVFYNHTNKVVSLEFYVNDGFSGNETFYPQIEFGENLTVWQPYAEEIYQLPQTLELGEWDSLNPQTGELVRATGRVVFDGTEDWSNQEGHYDTATKMFFSNNTLITSKLANRIPICSHFQSTYGLQSNAVDKEGIQINSLEQFSNFIYIKIDKSKLSSYNEAGFKAYLAEQYANGTPVTLEYELATPATEKIANVPKSYKAYNHGSETVNQGETDNSEYGAMPTVTNEYVVVLGVEE